MLAICERYGKEHNLVFSTDPVPKLSKTKCMYFCGRSKNVKYPDPVQLYGEDLPWVEHADHLGHTLHQSVTMDMDCNRARAKFIDRSVDTREQFYFAQPQQKLKMVQILCCDGYGSMLWNLEDNSAEQYFKSWNTCVKLIYGVPRSTYTYLVEGFFAENETSLRNQILGRYPGFYRKLLTSPSKEVRILARMVSGDPRSTTCRNLRYLREISKLDTVEHYSAWRVKDALPVKKVPEKEKWRLGLLNTLMGMQSVRFIMVQDSKRICAMIDSLCST